jgi:AcrR family transcriptional regulator
VPGERAKGLARARRLGHAAKPARIEAQRELLLEAMTEAAAEKGYEACRVEDVLGRSVLSRAMFYLHFKDKADCFMAAFEAESMHSLRRWRRPSRARRTRRREWRPASRRSSVP